MQTYKSASKRFITVILVISCRRINKQDDYDVNILGRNMNIIKRNMKDLSDGSNKVDLEINAEKT
jgi:hypothetical protein